MFIQKKDSKICKNNSPIPMETITLISLHKGHVIKSETGICLSSIFMAGTVRKGLISENVTNIVIFRVYAVFIFDWDDTVLCTSYLSSMQFLEINNDAKNLLKKLDDISSNLLSKVVAKGEVYIITNAAKGWVEYSSKL